MVADCGLCRLGWQCAAVDRREEVHAPVDDIQVKELAMDLSTVVEVDLGSSVWALGICGALALLILCATGVILSGYVGWQSPRGACRVRRCDPRLPPQTSP